MIRKYYILALTFLCLLCGQMSYGFDAEGDSGYTDEFGNFDWDSFIDQWTALIGEDRFFVYDHTNLMDYVAVLNGDDDPFNDLIVYTFIDPFYEGKNVPDFWSGIDGPYVNTTHIEFAYTDGYDKSGFDPNGYDSSGFNALGFDQNGYDINGLDWWGYDEYGYDINGYNHSGYNENGYDINGYDINGYDENGYDENGDFCQNSIACTGVIENCECVEDTYDTTYDISSYDFEPGKNNIFSDSGRPLRSGAPGNLIQIEPKSRN